MKTDAKPKTNAKVSRTTISLPESVFEAGKERAVMDRRDFSNYIAVLIEADVQSAKPAAVEVQS